MNRYQNVVLVIGTTVVVCGLVALLLSWGMAVYLLGLAAIPFGIWLSNHQKWLFRLMLASYFSNLTLPVLPGNLSLFHVLAVFYILLSILGGGLPNQLRQSWNMVSALALLFVLNMAVIVLVRGTGFRFLGDSNWGGLRYVELFITLALVLLARHTRLQPREWKATLGLLLGATCVPFLAEVLLLLSGGRVSQQYYFIQANQNTLLSLFTERQGGELIRFQSANRLGVYLLMLGLFLFSGPRRQKWAAGIVLVLGFLLVGLSGHRSGFIDLALIPWLFGLLWPGSRRLRYLLISGIACVLLVSLMYVIGPVLPYTFQRAISILPGIQVSPVAREDALATINWRVDLWMEALRELANHPSYLLIGKGLTYSGAEFEALGAGEYSEFYYWWAIVTSTYHQGILSLLILTGLPGLFLGVSFLLFGVVRHLRAHSSPWTNSMLQRAHFILFIYFCVIAIKFFAVYGDLYVSWPVFCVWMLILENILQTEKNQRACKNTYDSLRGRPCILVPMSDKRSQTERAR